MIFEGIRWVGKGLFIFYTIIAFIGIFYQLEYFKEKNKFYLLEILFTILSTLCLIYNFYTLYNNENEYEEIPTINERLFLVSNFVWGFLAILYPLWKLIEINYHKDNIDLQSIIPILRIIHIVLFSIWILYSYNKVPRDDNTSFISKMHKSTLLLNIVTILYYIAIEIPFNIKASFLYQDNNYSMIKTCQNYTKTSQKLCYGQSFFEIFFYSFCFLSVLLLINRLRTLQMKDHCRTFAMKKPSFYHLRHFDNYRHISQSFLAILISLTLIGSTIFCLVNYYKYENKEEPLIIYNYIDFGIYIIGIIANMVLLLEMRNWKFTNRCLSRIDKQIMEIGTIGQLIYAMSIVISSGNIALNYSQKLSYNDRTMNISSLLSYTAMIIELCAQRTNVIQLIKLKHQTYKRSHSKILLQMCPCMILMAFNFSMIPTSIFFLINPSNFKTLSIELNERIWVLLCYAKAPVLILHRFHGMFVFGYTLYQTW